MRMQSLDRDNLFMGLAIELARAAYDNDEVPVGAVIVQKRNNEVISAFSNQMRKQKSSIAHAEMLAIQKANKIIDNERLIGCEMFVSLEPCPMCAHAISISRLDALHFAAEDPKGGGVIHGPKIFESSSCHHKPEVKYGLMADESSKLLRSFFKSKRLK